MIGLFLAKVKKNSVQYNLLSEIEVLFFEHVVCLEGVLDRVLSTTYSVDYAL